MHFAAYSSKPLLFADSLFSLPWFANAQNKMSGMFSA